MASVNAKGTVPTTPGARPFWTSSTNPVLTGCLQSISDGGSCNTTWTVNATENNGTFEFYAIYENEFNYNTTPKVNITIRTVPIVTINSPTASVFRTAGQNLTVNYTYSGQSLHNISVGIVGASGLLNSTIVLGPANGTVTATTDVSIPATAADGKYSVNVTAYTSLNDSGSAQQN